MAVFRFFRYCNVRIFDEAAIRLEEAKTLNGVPPKPKWTRRKTYQRIRNEIQSPGSHSQDTTVQEASQYTAFCVSCELG
jgi:hypothetical protein